ncbi:MAG: hypothetical protein ACE5IY_15945 [bacterium]
MLDRVRRPDGLTFVLLCLSASLCACASTKGGQEPSEGYNVISHEEIIAALEKRPMQNAFELIQFLRPHYLRPRSQHSVAKGVIQAEPIVYVNGVRFGRINELYNISYHQVGKVEYLKSWQATQRFGMGHEGGAILITAK